MGTKHLVTMNSPRTLLLWLYVLIPTRSAAPINNVSCFDHLPAGCTCGDERPMNQLAFLHTVTCHGTVFESDPLSLRLSPQTEAIILEECNIESVASPDFFASQFSAVDEMARSNIKYIRLINNSNVHQQLKLNSLLCLFPQLEELHIVNNSMLEVNMVVNSSCLHSPLRILNLTRNAARFLPTETLKALRQRPNLTVDLTENSFSCDCNFVSTYEWLNQRHVHLVNPERYLCKDGYPESLAGRYVLQIDPDELRCLEGPVLLPLPSSSEGHEEETLGNIYSIIIVLGVMGAVVALFAFFLNFSFLLQCLNEERPFTVKRKKTGSQKHLLQRRKYSSLPSLSSETRT